MVDFIDMKFFVQAVALGSLSAAGRELGFSPAVASKRLARLEARLGIRLLQRNSRHLALTEEGTVYVEHCRQILEACEAAENLIGKGKHAATGILHVSCPVTLGRRLIGPAIASFVRIWPQLRIRLSLSDSIVDLLENNFDCAIRIGGPEDSRLVARHLSKNHRVICASPDYFLQYPPPVTPEDLSRHKAIILSTQMAEMVEWRMVHIANQQVKTVKVPVHLATDNGEQAHDWALAGMGLVYRSIWDVKQELDAGELIQVLPTWQSESVPIRVVFPSRQFLPARTRLFIDHLVDFYREKDPNKIGII